MTQKNTFDDIIPPVNNGTSAEGPAPKRSIRDIPIREKKPNKIDELLEETADMRAEHHTPPPVYTPPPTMKRESKSRKGLWIAIIVVIIALGFGAMALFNDATVDITLKTESIPVEVVATSTDNVASSSIAYKVLTVQKEGTKEVTATGPSAKVEKKATGTIIIYNKSAAAQQLIATTRFETPEGLVYRIDSGVNVPASGSVEAAVTADKAGESYNVDKKDFTVPGFKGTPKFDQFYGRSKTVMSGGFIGNMPKIADADLKAANDELKESLTAQAVADIQKQKAAGYVFFKDGILTTFTSSVGPSTGDGKAVITGKVSVEGLTFTRASIEKAIADTKNGQLYRFDNLEDLVLSRHNNNPVTSFVTGPVLLLKFSGTLTTGQSFDENALKNALAGKSKSQLNEILKMYPEISKASAVIRPVWKKSFPENADKIKINVTK